MTLRFVRRLLWAAILFFAIRLAPAYAEVQLTYSVFEPGAFTANQLSILNTAIDRSKRMWETSLTGYQPGITISTVPITVFAMDSGLGSANISGSVNQGGYSLSTGGYIHINRNEIENFANWQGVGANGLNFVDELMAHETGHVLGVGTLWSNNGVFQFDSFQYTAARGLAEYRAEFNPAANFIPVESAGPPGTPHAHWDQRIRSSSQEGNPANPWSLDPRIGVTDQFGRDLGLELMTGALDPDYREPFLSRTTIQSMRDLGFTVAAFEDFNGDGSVNTQDLNILTANLGATGLQIDSLAFGDLDRDRDVDAADLAAFPEPASAATTASLLVILASRRRRTQFADCPSA